MGTAVRRGSVSSYGKESPYSQPNANMVLGYRVVEVLPHYPALPLISNEAHAQLMIRAAAPSSRGRRRMGFYSTKMPDDFESYFSKWVAGEMTQKQIADELWVSQSVVSDSGIPRKAQPGQDSPRRSDRRVFFRSRKVLTWRNLAT